MTVLNVNFTRSHNLLIAEQSIVSSQDDIDEMFADKLAKGYEGLIIRALDDPYVWGRSAKLIKKKATKECILGCYDIVEGTGKYEGMIGSLRCSGLVEGKDVRVKVGSGLSDYDREMPPSYYIGRDIDVLYNDVVIAKKAAYYKLFLPRFKRVVGEMDT